MIDSIIKGGAILGGMIALVALTAMAIGFVRMLMQIIRDKDD